MILFKVVGLTCFDLRRLGKVDKLGMVGVNGGKFPAIRQHLDENIGGVYKDMDLTYASTSTFCRLRNLRRYAASMNSPKVARLTPKLVRSIYWPQRPRLNVLSSRQSRY